MIHTFEDERMIEVQSRGQLEDPDAHVETPRGRLMAAVAILVGLAVLGSYGQSLPALSSAPAPVVSVAK